VETREFLWAAHLEAEALEAWIEAGWLLPRDTGEGRRFSEVDLARVRLIRDLRELGANDDAVPVILHLIDQLHGLRRALRGVLSDMAAQSEGATRWRSPDNGDTYLQERE
jgi:chaperone modulatory protein CbpM